MLKLNRFNQMSWFEISGFIVWRLVYYIERNKNLYVYNAIVLLNANNNIYSHSVVRDMRDNNDILIS